MRTTLDKYLTRRSFLLAGGAGLLAAVPLVRAGLGAASGPHDVFLSASDDADGRHFVTACDVRGATLFSVEVETRCHGVALHRAHPDRAVVIARRPGTLAYDVDVRAGGIRRVLHAAPDRHFYGHAAFSRDGRVLFTSENDIPRGRGVVAVRDADDLRVLAEIPSFGVGPHELIALPDGRTLAIANGGLVTDLADGKRRRDLNVPTMDPSLVYVDVRDGKVLEQVRPDDHFASVRHLALAPDGTIAVAMQYEGPEANPYPVLGFHRGGTTIASADIPRDLRVRMQRYAASVCVAPSGVAAVTCPRGDVAAFFDVATGALLESHEVRDAGGVATVAGGTCFLVTTGLGETHEFDAATGRRIGGPGRHDEVRWDNHAVLASPA